MDWTDESIDGYFSRNTKHLNHLRRHHPYVSSVVFEPHCNVSKMCLLLLLSRYYLPPCTNENKLQSSGNCQLPFINEQKIMLFRNYPMPCIQEAKLQSWSFSKLITKMLSSAFLLFVLLYRNAPNPKTEVHTTLWILCTITHLIYNVKIYQC